VGDGYRVEVVVDEVDVDVEVELEDVVVIGTQSGSPRDRHLAGVSASYFSAHSSNG
jgi:hypothetical protein